MDERTQSLLESREPEDRVAGLRLVVLFEDGDAAEHATRLLDDGEAEVREHAARALGVTRGGGATARLERAAREDEDAIVRRTALAILGEIGEAAGARAIERFLEGAEGGEPLDRATAIESLRACGDPASAAVVAALAGDADARVRPLALHAWAALASEPRGLGGGGGLSARARGDLEALAKQVAVSGPLWAMPAAALVLGEEPARAFGVAARTATPRELDRAELRALELSLPVGTEILAALAGDSGETSSAPTPGAVVQAARELARRGDDRGVPVLARALYGPEVGRHLEAACGLAEVGLALGEPLLERALEHAAANDRARIARALGLLGRADGIQALGALLAGDVPFDRRAAALAFADLGRRDGVLELIKALDFAFRRERVAALGALRGLWSDGPTVEALAGHEARRAAVHGWERHFSRPE